MRDIPESRGPLDEETMRRPAEGERTAIGGYHGQFTMAAELILDALIARRLEAVRVANPEAGHLDDLQLVGPTRADGYQIKSSRYGEPLSFADLTRPAGGQPSLIAQLATGWRDGQRAHPAKRFVAHLRTNRRPSTGDTVPSDASSGARHFAAFLAQAWEPVHDGEDTTPRAGRWADAWKQLQEAAGLSDSELLPFVTDCNLEIGVGTAVAGSPDSAVAEQRSNDIEELAQYIYRVVASPRQLVELPVDRLLAELGWTTRLELAPNDFRVDANRYSPIRTTEAALRRSLDARTSGYVALLGTPGSGKSTLATMVLRTYAARAVRYYAFLPDAPDPASLRGESTTFLREVAVQLADAGLRVGTLPGYDRRELLQHLHEQLAQAGREYLESGQRTIVLVDGIDHIRRELRTVRSLVDDLPPPNALPEGVTIVIGSQHLNDLPSRIRHHLESDDSRIIEMEALDREAVREVAQRAISESTEGLTELLFEHSAGHPLALQYLLQHAQEADTVDEACRLVTAAPAYGDDIEEQYVVYWDQVKSDRELTNLLGLLARLRGPVEWPVLRTRFTPELLDRLRLYTQHYFRREAGSQQERWYFFHNSFRLFLVGRTMEVAPGKGDDRLDRSFHKALAAWCVDAPDGSPLRWDLIFHLAAAGDAQQLLAQATQQFFRNQFLELRPPDEIGADLRLGFREAVAARDLVAIARLALAASEVSQRESYLDEKRLISLMLSVGRISGALRRLRTGTRLRVGAVTALQLLPDLRRAGQESEARATFSLAEPLEFIHGSGPIEPGVQNESVSLLRAWAKEAAHYRDWKDVRTAIENLELSPETRWELTPAEASDWLRGELLLEASESLLAAGAKSEVVGLLSEWAAELPHNRRRWLVLAVRSMRRFGSSDTPLAEELMETALSLPLDPDERLVLADALMTVFGHETRAKDLVQGLEQPELAKDLSARDDFSQVEHRFRLNRLLSALGDRVDPNAAVPDAVDPRDEGLVRFERAVCRVAAIEGAAWAGRQFDEDLQDSALRVLRLYYTDARASRDWSRWYFATGQRPELFRRLVRAVAEFGGEAVSWLTRTIASEFTGAPQYWSAGSRRALLVALHGAGAERDWVIDELERVATEMTAGVDISGRVEHAIDQAEGWLEVKEEARAESELGRAISHTFGVGYDKDDQVEDWIRWMRQVNAVDGLRARDRITWFARAVVAMRDGEGGRDYAAARELVDATYDVSPAGALDLADWFLSERIGIAHEMWETLVRRGMERGGDLTMAEHVVIEVLMPIARDAPQDVVAALLNQRFKAERFAAVATARSIAAAADVFALPSTRDSWYRACAEALTSNGVDYTTAGFDADLLAPDTAPNSYSERLELEAADADASTTLTADEVRARAETVDAALDLVRRSRDSYFRWDRVLRRLVDRASAEDVARLATAFQSVHYATPVFADLAARMFKLGDRDAAWELGKQALAASSSGGWSRWYDGGSRLRAFEALVAVDPQRGRDLLWNTLGADLASESMKPSVSAADFTSLAQLVENDLPIVELWDEISDHAHALFDSTGVPEVTVPEFPEQTSHGVDDAMLELLVRLSVHPVRAVRSGGRRALAASVAARRPAAIRLFERLETLPLSHLETVLVAAEAVAATESGAEWMASHVADALATPDLSVRNLVRQLFSRTGAKTPATVGHPKALPALYRLDLSRAARTGDYLPDLAETLEALELSDELVAALAMTAGTDEENIVHRAAQLVEEIKAEDTWLALSENELRRLLDAASLKFPFLRTPRELGRRVLLRIAAEIDDAASLSARAGWQVLARLAASDPMLVRARPMSRPSELRLDPPTDWNTTDWANAELGAAPRIPRQVDGNAVIAEITEMKGFEWGAPTERRESLLVNPTVDVGEYKSEGLIFDSFFTAMTVEAYRRLSGLNDSHLVVRQLGIALNAPDWIALNPDIGRGCGWTPSSEGFMRWVDDKGNRMVESLWWCDGLIDHAPPNDGFAAEGCMVLASAPAFEQLLERQELARAVCTERRVEGEKPICRRKVELLPL